MGAMAYLPDQDWGEVGAAAIVLEPNVELNADELLAWMADKVARYKLPKSVHFFDELPKSGYGKVTKKLVRAAIQER